MAQRGIVVLLDRLLLPREKCSGGPWERAWPPSTARPVEEGGKDWAWLSRAINSAFSRSFFSSKALISSTLLC